MVCENWLAQLDQYLDGELPSAEMTAFDAHLRSCPACAAEGLARVQLKRAVKNSGLRYTPSAEFRRSVREKVAGRSRPRWNFTWVLATAALALFLVAAWALTIGRQRVRQQELLGELADSHVTTLASATPVDVVSTDRHTVKPWFEGRIPFTFNLPELQNPDLTLLGGRVTYLGQIPGAHLIYRLRKHQISVFIFPDQTLQTGFGGSPSTAHRQSFTVETWSQAGLRYFVVGDVSPTDMATLTSLLRSAASS